MGPYYFNIFWEPRAWTFRICKNIRVPKYIGVINRLHPQNQPFLKIHTNTGTALLASLLQSETKDIYVTTCMFSYFRVRTILCNCKKLHLFVCLLNFLVVICVICLLRSDPDQYSHQSKGRMIASYFKLSNKSPTYGRHWISRPVCLVALTQKILQQKL